MTVRPHYDQVGADLPGSIQNAMTDVMATAGVLLDRDLAPMVGQPFGNIDTGVFARAVFAHDRVNHANRNFIGPAQKRQGLMNRTRSMQVCCPGDEDTLGPME